jgi:hypothetical protein
MTRAELERVREWALQKLATGAEPRGPGISS